MMLCNLQIITRFIFPLAISHFALINTPVPVHCLRLFGSSSDKQNDPSAGGMRRVSSKTNLVVPAEVVAPNDENRPLKFDSRKSYQQFIEEERLQKVLLEKNEAERNLRDDIAKQVSINQELAEANRTLDAEIQQKKALLHTYYKPLRGSTALQAQFDSLHLHRKTDTQSSSRSSSTDSSRSECYVAAAASVQNNPNLVSLNEQLKGANLEICERKNEMKNLQADHLRLQKENDTKIGACKRLDRQILIHSNGNREWIRSQRTNVPALREESRKTGTYREGTEVPSIYERYWDSLAAERPQ